MSGTKSNNNKKVRSPKIFYSINPEFGACPSCGEKGVLKRSRPRTTWERILTTITPYSYYRCRKCGWRGPIFKYVITRESAKNLFLYFIYALITALIVKFVITKFIMK